MDGDPSLTDRLERLRAIERLIGGANALVTAADQLVSAHERDSDFDLERAVQHLRWSAAELAGIARRAQ